MDKILKLTPRKEQILEELFSNRIAELNYEIGSVIQFGGEPDSNLQEEKEHIEEMQHNIKT